MGILRVFFALIVLLGHSPASYYLLPIFSGSLAVEAFYIISGFYIQLIIGKYARTTNWIGRFYASRLTRIFSTYYLVLIATLAFRISTDHSPLHGLFFKGTTLSIAYGLFINVFLIGQDVARMLSFDLKTGAMHLAASGVSSPSEIPFAAFEILVQAWTLAPEIMFYLLSPFLLRTKTVTIAAILGFSLYLKCTLERHGVNWTLTFFPCELGYFLMGAVACRVYERHVRHAESKLLTVVPAVVFSTAILFLSVVWYRIP